MLKARCRCISYELYGNERSAYGRVKITQHCNRKLIDRKQHKKESHSLCLVCSMLFLSNINSYHHHIHKGYKTSAPMKNSSGYIITEGVHS